jgi:hypothetical protein
MKKNNVLWVRNEKEKKIVRDEAVIKSRKKEKKPGYCKQNERKKED